MIAFAHGVHAAQVHGGPAWVDTEQYDVLAKAASPDAGPDQIKAMVRSLLADRFKLVVHRQTQELPVYTLVVGKNGSKMQDAKEGEKTQVAFVGGGHLVCTRTNLLGLIITLSNTIETPVIDKTGLTGFYDFTLEWRDSLSQKSGNVLECLIALVYLCIILECLEDAQTRACIGMLTRRQGNSNCDQQKTK